MGAESEEKPRQVVCYQAGNGTGILDMEERRESSLWSPPTHVTGLLASLAIVAGRLTGMPAGVGGWNNWKSVEEGRRYEWGGLQQALCYWVRDETGFGEEDREDLQLA